MSLFNKMLASVGIGSAKVDTKLESEIVSPGGELRGIVEIQGGNVEQRIEDIYLSLHTTYVKETDDKKYTVNGLIDRFQLAESLILKANEKKVIPFSFLLPADVPLTIGKTKVWISTGLDIKGAVDPTDKDYLRVVPNQLMDSVFQSLSGLGFRLREAECEQAPHRLRRRLPFIQEFEFVPISGPFRGRLDELEITFFPNSNGDLEVLMQVDRKVRGLGSLFSEALNMDEANIRFVLNQGDIPSMQGKLHSLIQNYS
ncbi:sporulation-control protein [Cytobacillus eiseniae]|uniref:Sporulation-control protein n=1 Tax=Cytobacillus eiseniae TaxID=762947 RepID=A0ABS4RE94_9BACI|nr:sporulation protein [Cytobacillus eiseniae]MBP2241224.1 sporulation-control protein [Cytobacillus eiseniae]